MAARGLDEVQPSRLPGVASAAIAAIGCWAAGLYRLTSETADPNSYLKTIAHGIGIYFLAKGVFVGKQLWESARQTILLKEIRDATIWEMSERAKRGGSREP